MFVLEFKREEVTALKLQQTECCRKKTSQGSPLSQLRCLSTPQCCLSPALVASGHLSSCWSSALSFQPTRGPREARTATRRGQRPLSHVVPTAECTCILLRHWARHAAPQNVCFLTCRQSMPGPSEQSESGSPHLAKDILHNVKHAYFKKTTLVFLSQTYTFRTTYAFLTTLLHACLSMSVCLNRQKSYRWP